MIGSIQRTVSNVGLLFFVTFFFSFCELVVIRQVISNFQGVKMVNGSIFLIFRFFFSNEIELCTHGFCNSIPIFNFFFPFFFSWLFFGPSFGQFYHSAYEIHWTDFLFMLGAQSKYVWCVMGMNKLDRIEFRNELRIKNWFFFRLFVVNQHNT